jgi:ribosomal protein S18 acetylase RimI-like enzyme
VVSIREAIRGDELAISAIGRTAMPVQFAGLVDAEVVDAVATQTYEPSVVADCIRRCGAAADAVFLVAEVAGEVVGYVHFDAFDGEPELHRIYIDARHRSRGVGAALVSALHARLHPETYILFVVKGNDGAVRFYERHGLYHESTLNGLEHYRAAGVEFPPDPKPFELIVMRYRRTADRQG